MTDSTTYGPRRIEVVPDLSGQFRERSCVDFSKIQTAERSAMPYRARQCAYPPHSSRERPTMTKEMCHRGCMRNTVMIMVDPP